MKYFSLIIIMILLSSCGGESEKGIPTENATAARDFDVYTYPIKSSKDISSVNKIIHSFKRGDTVKVRVSLKYCEKSGTCSAQLKNTSGYFLPSDIGLKDPLILEDGIYYGFRNSDHSKKSPNQLYAEDWETLCNKINGHTKNFGDTIGNDTVVGRFNSKFAQLAANGATLQYKGAVASESNDYGGYDKNGNARSCVMMVKVSGMLNGSTLTKEEMIYVNRISVYKDDILAHGVGEARSSYAIASP